MIGYTPSQLKGIIFVYLEIEYKTRQNVLSIMHACYLQFVWKRRQLHSKWTECNYGEAIERKENRILIR